MARRQGTLGAYMYRCPYPECWHVGSIITKVHCRTHHNMERDELFDKYGKPIPITFAPSKKNKE